MARLGYIFGNLMVNLHVKNYKLRERGITILQQATGVGAPAARRALKSAGDEVPLALIMLQTGASRSEAVSALKTAQGNVRRAIRSARPM